jgi:hypothetical protein
MFLLASRSLFEEAAVANERLDDNEEPGGKVDSSSKPGAGGKVLNGGGGKSLLGGVRGGPTRETEAWRVSSRGRVAEVAEMGDGGGDGALGHGGTLRRKSGIDCGLQVELPSVIPLGRERKRGTGSGSGGLFLSVNVDEEPDLYKDGYGAYASSSNSPKSTTFSHPCVKSNGSGMCLLFRRLLDRFLPHRN